MIGKKIYEIRKHRNLSLSGLAERAGISKSYLSNIERNLNQNPSIQVLNKIAQVLEVNVQMLLCTETKEATPNSCTKQENDLMELINKIKESGIEKEQIEEYKTLIEFIKWKNEN